MTEDAVQEIPAAWSKAWECYRRHQNQDDAKRELGIGGAKLRRMLRGYAALTGETLPKPRQKPPATLTQEQVNTWEAWGEHRTMDATAEALGVHLNTVRNRIARYRKFNDLPSTARPSPQRSRRPRERKPPTIDQRLDALLQALEEADACGNDDQVHTLRAAIHRIERRVYGRGFEPLRRKPKGER